MIDHVSRSPVPAQPTLTVIVARLTANGGVVLTTQRDPADDVTVTAVERPPATLAAFDQRLRELAGPDFPRLPAHTSVLIDAEHLGQALWDALHVARRGTWRLYENRGRDRQELANALRVAQHEKRLHIVSGPHDEALRKALLSYRVEVGEDGVNGAELVVGLALAVVGRRLSPPRIY